MKKFLSIILTALMCLTLIFSFGCVGESETTTEKEPEKNPLKYYEHSFEKFNNHAEPTYKLPGCEDLIPPQSMDVSEEMGLVFVAGYTFKYYSKYGTEMQDPTLYVLDMESGDLVGRYKLYETPTVQHFSYVGGLAVTSKNLFISSQSNLYRISLSQFATPSIDSTIVIDEIIPVHAKAAFCAYAEGKIWVGDFYREPNYALPSDRPIPEGYSDTQAWVVGYELEDTDREIKQSPQGYNKVTPDCVILIGDLIRGFTIQNGYIVYARSYGGVATLYFKEYPVNKYEAETTVKLNGVDVPVWSMPKENAYFMKTMEGCLQVSNFNDKLILLFSTGTEFYNGNPAPEEEYATEYAWVIKMPTQKEMEE